MLQYMRHDCMHLTAERYDACRPNMDLLFDMFIRVMDLVASGVKFIPRPNLIPWAISSL